MQYQNEFPLNWPAGVPQTPESARKEAPFRVTGDQARKEMLLELSRIGAKDAVFSSDRRVNRDGSISIAKVAGYVSPAIAVYFKRKGKSVVLACDRYLTISDNMRAIGKTIEAMRGIERWGASDMLDRAFTGFQVLAAPEQWWQVLGVTSNASRDEINRAYRFLAKKAHPDLVGSDAAMSRLNVARDQGLAGLDR